jgi:hypothetical protein
MYNLLYGCIVATTYDERDNERFYYIITNEGVDEVGCEITYKVPESHGMLLKHGENLWNAYKSGLVDACTIQVQDKEFKVIQLLIY